MYIPSFFAETDEENLLAFMREFNFAALVTAENDLPAATHLPFIVEKRDGDKIVLSAHLAKANLQWKQFENKQALVIFQQPHAYVSPLLYGEKNNVPTWNYVAVHAYGKVEAFKTAEENLAFLAKMVEAFDPDYFQTDWQEIYDDYKINLARGVVAFEIEVTDLQGKKKLNQNKPGKTAENVIEAFEKSDRENEKLIAKYMKEVHRRQDTD
ncbi:MAG TPA: FMN-binding negative transcriptional regulator [Pyrinomonadaceae bacterium]|nr:FMN-binding negative transcriptional regulator [Pyrinomonadaceae bacterium]